MIDYCDKGWELYDKWVYFADRSELDQSCINDREEAYAKFLEHKLNCPRCDILDKGD